MTRCLVIGGNGFVGSYVVDELAAAGHEVTAFDRFSGDIRYTAPGVRHVSGDFLNTGELADVVAGHEVVYHLLSTTNPATAEADPLLDVRTNVTGSIELFRIAAHAGVRHVYFASSGGAVYGDQPTAVVSETAIPQPVSPYAIGKLSIERYLSYFRRTSGLDSTVLRLSNPYGPRQNPNRRQGVIPIFLRGLHRGEPLVVYGDGSMIRDYIYVEDLARMIVRPLGHDAPHDLYNLGSGVAHSLDEILDAIARVTGTQPQVVRRPAPSTFVERIALSVDRFHADFGAPVAPLSLEDGIRRTWDDIVERDG